MQKPMNLKTIRFSIVKSLLLASAIVFSSLVVSCGTDEDWVIPGQPTLAPSLPETPVPTVAPTPALFDYTQVSCEGKPIYAWRQPGTFINFFVDYVRTWKATKQLTEPPSYFLNDRCLWHGDFDFGSAINDPPTSGLQVEKTGSCQTSQYTRTTHTTISVIGREEITTRLGTYQALRVDTAISAADSEYTINYREWYVCGYGVIYSEESFSDNMGVTVYIWELLSYTPLTTDESRVRYILADIQLGGVDGYYREHVDAEEVAEALRRWDAGITVTNIDQFERKLVGETWQVVYAGTETLINGSDVVLSTDSVP
jgi:hypothetical protein